MLYCTAVLDFLSEFACTTYLFADFGTSMLSWNDTVSQLGGLSKLGLILGAGIALTFALALAYCHYKINSDYTSKIPPSPPKTWRKISSAYAFCFLYYVACAVSIANFSITD
jgi:hypothetical protein